MGHAQKNGPIFLCVGGKSPPERLFRLWAQYAAPPSLYDQTQDLPGFLACGWGDNAPHQKKLKKEFDVSLRHAYKPASPTG